MLRAVMQAASSNTAVLVVVDAPALEFAQFEVAQLARLWLLVVVRWW